MLNREQKKAVTYNKGPLLIIAGAGTGKTTVKKNYPTDKSIMNLGNIFPELTIPSFGNIII